MCKTILHEVIFAMKYSFIQTNPHTTKVINRVYNDYFLKVECFEDALIISVICKCFNNEKRIRIIFIF